METRGISKLDLKRRNRKQILLAIRESGTLARVDIANKLALTRAAVTIITNQMIQQNILEDLSTAKEDADQPKKKGRKKTLIRINPNYKFVLGAVISEDYISVGLSNIGGEVLDKMYQEIGDSTEQQEIVSFIVSACNQLMKNSSLAAKQILGLGVGIVPQRWEQMRAEYRTTGVVFPKFSYLLEMELSIPVQCASAVELYALSNVDYLDHSLSNQLLIYSGAEYHTAIISGNDLLPGYNKNSTAINYFIVSPNGTAASGYPNGSVHAELTKSAIIRKAAKVLGKKSDQVHMSDVHAAYLEGNKKIVDLLNSVTEKMALLIFNFGAAHCAKRIILQGFEMIPETEELLRKNFEKLLDNDRDAVSLEFSKISPDHSFLAGSGLAVEKLFFEMGGMQKIETANTRD